jgi:ATP-dependent helicase/nuclease subunit A
VTAMTDHGDEIARERALDVTQSFLVQAPAGSGKTGLLIQRYLALLAHVDRPERIVAMTFTRKAAAEMRERVWRALRDAAEGAAVDPDRPHDEVTRCLALAALAQDQNCNWQLLTQPSRLRMLTIDALAASLSRQAPVATGLGALPKFVDDASQFYEQGVRAALAAADPTDPAWRRFLARLDNDADHAVNLLATMLARRDQWLRLPIGAGSSELRGDLEQALRVEIDSALLRVRAMIPASLFAGLAESQRYAATHFANTPGKEDSAKSLATLADLGGVPPATADALPSWHVLADFLMTKDKNRPAFRKTVDERNGFPPRDKEPGSAERVAAKLAMMELLRAAREIPGLTESLNSARTLPPPTYDNASWDFVDATLTLLPHVAGHLLTVFAAEGVADFSEATLRALAALGNADDPGELLLAVDYRLGHLLVDEFQDTSWTHHELIERLTSGWQSGDGRTLFAVGDPMQSIYRFREAEVGIFLSAQQSAQVAGIPVQCLDLTRNFRSQEAIVAWVNSVFPQVLPPVSDPSRGEVAYKHVLATRRSPDDEAPTLDVVADRTEEAQTVVRRIREAQRAGSDEIAVLVRARTHLDLLLPAFRDEGIDYAAIELETLAQRLATRDLISLTRALTQPADRLATLALLRAPWCGLLLPDLLVLAGHPGQRPILDTLADVDVVTHLTPDGQARVERMRRCLDAANAERGRTSLSRRVRATWLSLGGPACGDGAIDVAGAERFFALLAQYERAGDAADWDAFVAATGKLFAESEPSDLSRVQVMTVHKAKGLEFDTVIMPGLDRPTAPGDEPALRWKQRERDGRQMLLLAPLRAREGVLSEPDPVYQYLRALNATEEAAERGRLLYVACTRAKRRLHLVAVVGTKRVKDEENVLWRNPRSTSALAQLWPALHAQVSPPPKEADTVERDEDEDADENEDDATPVSQPLRRLSLDWNLPEPSTEIPDNSRSVDTDTNPVAFDWAHATAAAIGTIAHRMLAQIATEGLKAWDSNPDRVVGERDRIIAELAGEGVAPEERAEAAVRIENAVARTLADVRGRWLFDPAHVDAQSEWALAGFDRDTLRHVTLDRTFVADGVRWIVDFKTGRHEGADAETYLDREMTRYREQLERYARIVSEFDARPIRLALYFPLVDAGWREWTFS